MQEEDKKKMGGRPQVEENTSVASEGGDGVVNGEVKVVCEINKSEEGRSGGGSIDGGDSLSFSGEDALSVEVVGEDAVTMEAATAPPQLSRKELLEALCAQLEELFSLSSLKAGTFPATYLNAQMCIPLDFVAQMNQVKALTQDKDVIVEAAKISSACIITPNGMRPNMRSERITIILRDIPSSTDPRRVMAIFEDAGMEAPITVRPDVGDTWFVTCKTEDDAMKSIIGLRVHTFEGKPIKARLKSENLLRSILPQTSASASGSNNVAPPLSTLPTSPVINSQPPQAVVLPLGAANSPQASAIPPAVLSPYPMGSGPVQPQIGSLFSGQMNRGPPPSSFSPGMSHLFSARGLNPPRLLPGNPVMPQGGISVGTVGAYPPPVVDPYTMQNWLSYNMIPQQPLIHQWRMSGGGGGSVNPGLRVGHHNRNASVGAINGGGGGKSGERGRGHFPNASMPGNMFRTPTGVVVNPMFGYGGKNANRAQSYQQFSQQYGAGVQATDSRDRTAIPSRGFRFRNRGRSGGSVMNRGGRGQVADTEMGGGESKLRRDTSYNYKAKQPDLSCSTHFPPLPGQDAGDDVGGGGTANSSSSSIGLGTGDLGTSEGAASHLTEQSHGGESASPTLLSFSDNALREKPNDGDNNDNIGGGKGSDGSESVPCTPTSSCAGGGALSNSNSSGNGNPDGVDNLLNRSSKVEQQNNKVEAGGLKLEANAAADAALLNLQVSEITDRSDSTDVLSLPPSQEGPNHHTNYTNATSAAVAKQPEEVKCIESTPVFGAYAAALMKKSTPVKGSKPDSKTAASSGKTSPTGGKQPPSDTKSEKGGGGGGGTSGRALYNVSNSVTSPEEKSTRNNNSNKGLPSDSSGSTKSESTKAHVGFLKQLDNTTTVKVSSENEMGISQSVAEASDTSGSPQLVAAEAASSFCDPAPNMANRGGSAWSKRSFLDAVMAQPPQKATPACP